MASKTRSEKTTHEHAFHPAPSAELSPGAIPTRMVCGLCGAERALTAAEKGGRISYPYGG